MPTRRIDDATPHWRANQCLDPDHNVPTMQYFPPGRYEHECPSCHHVFVFTVHPGQAMTIR